MIFKVPLSGGGLILPLWFPQALSREFRAHWSSGPARSARTGLTISTDRPQMESRPYEFLLQSQCACWLHPQIHSPFLPDAQPPKPRPHFLIPVMLVLSHVWLFWTPWPVALQAPLFMKFPVKNINTGTGCHFLLQEIFLTQGSNPQLSHLLHWQGDSLPLTPPGNA